MSAEAWGVLIAVAGFGSAQIGLLLHIAFRAGESKQRIVTLEDRADAHDKRFDRVEGAQAELVRDVAKLQGRELIA